MNLPNKLTITRILLIPALVILMYLPSDACRWAAAAVFALAALTDYFDGYIARRDHLESDFGRFLDPVADKLLVLSALTMLLHQGRAPAFLLIILLARELSVDGLRMIAAGKGQVIAAGWLGKVKTVSQLFLVLWLMLTPMSWFSWAAIGWVAVITLWGGVDYFLKNGKALWPEAKQ